MFEDLHLVAEDGRAVAVFSASLELRTALADALSWQVTSRFQAGALDEAEAVLEMRAAGALADRLDEHRGLEGRAPVRVNADHVRLLIGAASAYVMERDVESYQAPEERERIAQLRELIDPLFDLVANLDRADEVLGASSI
ncbi:MAG: hypothetical protein QOJ57_195 [Thermoleophilaceae bacterium]|nr:hypothetical protein [Thermoleophilaceae bacterium]